MLRAEELRKVFRTPRAGVVEAVRGATFEVAAGEVFGLLGPNGAGKTTLLRMLAMIITPTSGRCFVNGVAADEAARPDPRIDWFPVGKHTALRAVDRARGAAYFRAPLRHAGGGHPDGAWTRFRRCSHGRIHQPAL